MRRYYFLPAALLLVSAAFAQAPATGFPPYGSFEQGHFDAVNRQNLNVNFGVPIVSLPGRGTSFNFSLIYDSLVWANAGGSWFPVGTGSWGWKTKSPIGAIFYTYAHTSTLHRCSVDYSDYKEEDNWSNYRYTNVAGTNHGFAVSWKVVYDYCTGSTTTTGTATGYAVDGSGYYININSPDAPLVVSRGGMRITSSGLEDPNGNIISQVVVSGTETDWKDTANHTALRMSCLS